MNGENIPKLFLNHFSEDIPSFPGEEPGRTYLILKRISLSKCMNCTT